MVEVSRFPHILPCCPSFWMCSLLPCSLAVRRQWVAALLQALRTGDARQTGLVFSRSHQALASVSCLAFKTPLLTPIRWEKWRTWQAWSPGSRWASFQSPRVSVGGRDSIEELLAGNTNYHDCLPFSSGAASSGRYSVHLAVMLSEGSQDWLTIAVIVKLWVFRAPPLQWQAM